MKEKPDIALQLANRQESTEAAQKRLHREKHQEELLALNQKPLSDDSQRESPTCASAAEKRVALENSKTDALVQQLTKQVQQLTEEVSQLHAMNNQSGISRSPLHSMQR